jgi:hypothetical protein
MKIIRPLFLLGLLAGYSLLQPVSIPEISPPLIQEEVYSWVGPVAGNMLFPCAAGIGWVDPGGRIITWDPDKREAGQAVALPFAVAERPFRQGDFLTLRSQADDRWLIFDLARMETVRVVNGTGARRVLGVDGRHWVYLDGGYLVVSHWPDPAVSYRQPVVEKEFFNCCFVGERILVMSRGHLFIFWKQSGRFERRPLPLPATGEFASVAQEIYYGSSQRLLVKYSLPKRSLAWKLRLGNDLIGRPLVRDGAIVLGTADNTILQVGARGSVRGWRLLDSILEQALVPMDGHLAAFLLDGRVVFIRDRGLGTTAFTLQGRPAGVPLAYGGYLYFFLQDGGPAHKLQRLGNRYGIDIELTPGPAQWLGGTVTISFQTRNLIVPRSRCLIRDDSGKTLLVKDFKTAGRGSLVWLPQRPGTYRVQVSAEALNRREQAEASLRVFDLRAIIPLWRLFWIG